ncbi:hypothetical protein XA68_13223 [Ophiocordyceps unilateralis]|uniref:Uncharacterized protein n=1 Tax=Ophiocordyceps unilateralis TaxID=268505 RepID=A0A2A9PCM7_OPHUN|nr:hypothetical protein XA68_13223 [Ophiocordyceps unilateralis]
MAKLKDGRRGAPTPSLKLSGGGGGLCGVAEPTSPPETPTVRRPAHPPPAPFYRFSRPLSQDPNIKPMGKGHQFSYRPAEGPTQLSPRSSSEPSLSASGLGSSAADVEAYSSPPPSTAAAAAADSADGRAEPENDSDSDSGSDYGSGACDHVQTPGLGSKVEGDLVIEEVDPMDSECENLEVLHPTEIESIRSSCHKDLDRGMMQDLKNLNCSTEASDYDPSPANDDEEEAFLQQRQELRRRRRMSLSSSFGKRTHSELSDSDNDDAGPLDDVNDVGSSARRLRKRLHRGSLLFQDPPEPRIDELDEPDSASDGDAAAETSLARELPYYNTMEMMEMDSS